MSGQRPLGSNIQTVSGLGARGNEQRLTIDVTPLPRLEDLRQGLRMPGHASYSSLGHRPGQPISQKTAENSGPPLLGGTACPSSPVVKSNSLRSPSEPTYF